MRAIEVSEITKAVTKLSMDANYFLGDDVYCALVKGKEQEESPLGKEILDQIIKNAQIARNEQKPMCQDTGLAVVFVELGQEVQIVGGLLEDAINRGVAEGYELGFLRKSAVEEPLFQRKNTGDNTPAIIHISLVAGNKLKIVLAPKGGGSENMSTLKMLKPSDGIAGVKKLVVETVKNAGSNPCPPIVIGLGIGGTMEKAACLAKKALIRPLNVRNAHPDYAKLEQELLELVNRTGVGPQGLGGTVTALSVNIEWYPTHIASLPVAVNLNCHSTRHAEIIL